jgi:hypothetical protein
VVEVAGQITVMGSDCFERLYGETTGGEDALYGGDAGSAGRMLTAEERELMEANTTAFIDVMRSEYEQLLEAQADSLEIELAAKLVRFDAEQERAKRLSAAVEREQHARDEQERVRREKEALDRAIEEFDTRKRAIIESDVRDELASKHHINVDLPGWKGWYLTIVRQRITEALGKGQPEATVQGKWFDAERAPQRSSAKDTLDEEGEAESGVEQDREVAEERPKPARGSSYIEDDDEEQSETERQQWSREKGGSGQESLW